MDYVSMSCVHAVWMGTCMHAYIYIYIEREREREREWERERERYNSEKWLMEDATFLRLINKN